MTVFNPFPTSCTPPLSKRIDEIDWLKFVFIVLMVAFHLVYIGDTYPVAKRFVYTFHMPAFLLISGYMMNTAKRPRSFFKGMLFIFVPYVLVESGYVVMASILPIREHIAQLTPAVFLEKLLLHPLGPYWYLHTLLLCGVAEYMVLRFHKQPLPFRGALLVAVYYVMSHCLGILSFTNAMYFLVGAMLRQSGVAFLMFFRRSWWSVVFVALIALNPGNFDKSSVAGVCLVYFMMSLCLCVYPYIRGRWRKAALYVGRHTLLLLVFSPVFTILAKAYQPWLLAVEPFGILFMCVSLVFAVAGSLAVGYVLDKLHLSKYIFGRESVLS